MFEPFSDLQLREMENARKNLTRLDHRDSWLWWSAITVMLLLTFAVIAVSLPGILRESDQVFQLNLNLAIHALVGLVLLFNVYVVYQQWLIRRLRKQTAQHLELLSSLKTRAEEFHRLATRDPLTGLSNRRLGEERLTGEVARSERYGHPLSVLMLDLNRFKAINDQYGHGAGDATLQAFAERLNKVIRTSDLAVRLGGDEFLVILPECPAERIPNLLERLGGSLEVQYQERKFMVSSAAGWAGYKNGETPEQLIERADKALYEKKREQHAQTARPVLVRNTKSDTRT
ncbi:MAG TPA: GGDEF domain-containing protein [Candidatus Acidoferrales bacterium]|nr:GGDEF domain-containing protein [Candidatus Acidoferrales bacterium]